MSGGASKGAKRLWHRLGGPLKVGLLWLYQNDPAYTLTAPPEVPVQLEKLDSIFTTSLVITF